MTISLPKVLVWAETGEAERAASLLRPPPPAEDFQEAVADIISQVREDGDVALHGYSEKFDQVSLKHLEVTADEWSKAESMCDPAVLQAIDEAISRIYAFHAVGKPSPVSMETSPGLLCEARYLPISPVGLYVPGGSAPLI